ncbi:helix-turn-helix domain-containing protein [Haematobacter genomosp. 1]|uniref:Homeodomain-like domain-containing protein n=1 Tax=Haematobacter genomosp. 1 TaxID=366618 RepID=A0A212A6R8_9RHOB|nr:helix-turn-helix domain-containing protein [Haematobacter genomosp. 1]OWJ74614.1 hypothetical protein CDV49_19050 [Haematobacter genomosp. 1]
MTIHPSSTLDMEKLRKVRALMLGGKTEGERLAARGRAEVLAARAGVTLQQALSKLDAAKQAAPQSGNPFAGFADWMEEKEPGYKAEQARRRADREANRLARCKELLAEYGSEKAVFVPTDLEKRLRRALLPLREGGDSFKGWVAGNPTPAMWAAIQAAAPLPDTLHGIWAEHAAWEKLVTDRITFEPYYDAPAHVRARQAALERHMDRTPAPSIEGMRARLAWLAHLNDRGFTRDIHDDEAMIATLRADFEAIAAGVQGMCQTHTPAQRPAQRRAAVLDLLTTEPGLSDREIARRVGCSPQTVGNWRRRKAEDGR